jgi:hypothetical protein
MHRALRFVLLALLALGAIAPVAAQPEATPVASPVATPEPGATPVAATDLPAWIELGPGGAVTARAVAAGDCPAITIDEVSYVMDVRATPTDSHPVTVCETAIPAGSGSVAVGGTPLRLPAVNPERVLVIGDTGCRLKEGDSWQACNDPAAWPFAEVARLGAAWQPDLVIHVGDYLYREAPCPEGNAGCAGSPWGNTWASWEADFFAPAAPLLEAAPWIFLRGNHEDCSRAGEDWFRYLDPRPLPASCLDYTDPYAVPIGDVTAVVMDVAAAGDTSSDPATTEAFKGQFADVERLAGDGQAWLLTHRPFWSIADDGSGGHIEWTTATYTGAGYLQPPPAFDVVLAGHVHMGQVLTFTAESGRPVELIAGHGGTSLEMETGVFTGADIGDESMARGWRWAEFGFIGMERVDTGWVATTPMLNGTTALSCLIMETAVACAP